MTFFYVMGGGLGHLYRVRTFINQEHLSPFKIVTNNSLAIRLFHEKEILYVKGDTPEMLSSQIQGMFKYTDSLFVDTFPVGLFGELQGLQVKQMHYLARRLKWNTYRSLLGTNVPHFARTYLLEDLEPEHEAFVNQHSASVSTLKLVYPSPAPDCIPLELIPAGQPIWLLVHAFIQEEVDALVRYAQEVAQLEKESPVFVLLSDQKISDERVFCHTYFPASDWFPLVDKIFIGGGFNSIQQTAAYRSKVKAIPFPRKYDDQQWRIAACMTNSYPFKG